MTIWIVRVDFRLSFFVFVFRSCFFFDPGPAVRHFVSVSSLSFRPFVFRVVVIIIINRYLVSFVFVPFSSCTYWISMFVVPLCYYCADKLLLMK